MFHRIDGDDVEDMPAERFFSYADRLIAYKGVIRMRAEEESEKSSPRNSPTPNTSSKASAGDSQGKKYYRDINLNPELAQYFD